MRSLTRVANSAKNEKFPSHRGWSAFGTLQVISVRNDRLENLIPIIGLAAKQDTIIGNLKIDRARVLCAFLYSDLSFRQKPRQHSSYQERQ